MLVVIGEWTGGRTAVMRAIVVGYGIHESSVRALGWAAALVQRTGAKLVVASVLRPSHHAAEPDEHDERRRSIQVLLDRVGQPDAEVVLTTGDVGEGLQRTCRDQRAELIVVGHRDSVLPWGLGEHGAAEHLLRHGSNPFVVVSDEAPLPRSEGRLVVTVGIDGSPANTEAVETIAAIVADLDARAHPVYAADTGASTSADAPGAILLHQQAVEELAARLPGGPALEIVNDEPVAGLRRAAGNADADLIAVGTHGHSTLADRLTGQLAHHLIHHADRAVLVVPRHSARPA
jgi:nucleotide-binding universal stress UspA family protein